MQATDLTTVPAHALRSPHAPPSGGGTSSALGSHASPSCAPPWQVKVPQPGSSMPYTPRYVRRMLWCELGSCVSSMRLTAKHSSPAPPHSSGHGKRCSAGTLADTSYGTAKHTSLSPLTGTGHGGE